MNISWIRLASSSSDDGEHRSIFPALSRASSQSSWDPGMMLELSPGIKPVGALRRVTYASGGAAEPPNPVRGTDSLSTPPVAWGGSDAPNRRAEAGNQRETLRRVQTRQSGRKLTDERRQICLTGIRERQASHDCGGSGAALPTISAQTTSRNKHFGNETKGSNEYSQPPGSMANCCRTKRRRWH